MLFESDIKIRIKNFECWSFWHPQITEAVRATTNLFGQKQKLHTTKT